MKRIIKVISLILVFVISITAFSIADNEELDDSRFVKVGLYWGSNSLSSCTLKSDYGFNVYDEDGILIDYIDDTQIDLDINSSLLEHKKNRIFMSAAEDEDDRIVTLVANSTSKKYRDGILIYENNGLRVINYVDIEHYVWGVVNREMSSKNPEEALKAQAVCARTYVTRAKEIGGGHDNYGFDVCSTTDCQVYGAVSSENSITTQACQDTAGIIMTYKGEPTYSYFSSSNGGYTLSLYDAWGLDDVPYLQSNPDIYNPNITPASPWKFRNTFEEIRTKLINAGYKDVGKIKSFSITNMTSFGAVTQITIKGSQNTVVVPRSRIMSVFNLKSSFFAIGNDDYKSLSTPVEVSSTTGSLKDLKTCYILSADGISTASVDTLNIYDGNTITKYKANNDKTYIDDSDVCTDGYVYWAGQGFGHSIGMSQYGAFEMANQGFDYEDILDHYYPGVKLTEWY